MKRYIMTESGIQEVSKLACHWHIEATTKSAALQKLALFGARCIDDPPELEAKNGAWRLITRSQHGGWNIDSGVVRSDGSRTFALCSAHVARKSEIDDKTASFDYYSSDAYQDQE